MTSYVACVPFDGSRHRTQSFHSGVDSLDRWLRDYAGQSERRDASRTFVTVGADDEVAGYYSILAAQVAYMEATSGARRSMSRHFPIPAALVARLAVDQDHQGQGLGRSLLLDALRRIERASQIIGIRVVLVHAVDPGAAAFYRHFGFAQTEFDALTLMVTLSAVRRVIDG